MPQADRPDYYRMMGLPRTASAEEIKAEYRNLARKRHPDAGGSTHEFVALQEAYEVLGDADKRAEYDRYLMARAKASSTAREASVFDLRPRAEPAPQPAAPASPAGPRPSRRELDELLRKGARHEADAMARRWISNGHDEGYAHYVLGLLKLKEGQPDEACSRFSLAMQHEPKNTEYEAMFEKAARQGTTGTATAPKRLGCFGAVVGLGGLLALAMPWSLGLWPGSSR